MFIVSALQGAMGLVRAALASILLVWVPLADAATCGGDKASAPIEHSLSAEQITAGQAASDASTPSEDASSPLDAHCVHGHCHQPIAPQSSQGVIIFALQAAKAEPHDTAVLVSYVTSGMERPPKA